MTNEFDEFIQSKNNITNQTKKNYRNQYKSIVNVLGKQILESSDEEIINAIHQLANGNYSSEFTIYFLYNLLLNNSLI